MVSFAQIHAAQVSDTPHALCVVTKISGSTPRKVGARMLVEHNKTSHGKIAGTLGGGAIEHQVRADAIETIENGHPTSRQYALTHELNMCCGGTMEIYIEPLLAAPKCIVLGAGHIGQALCELASKSGFNTYIADPRRDLLSDSHFPLAHKLYPDYKTYDLDQMPFGQNTFVVIATHSHENDQVLTQHILPRQYRYLGLVGSRRKAAMTIKRCQALGLDATTIDSPAGIDICAQTPFEIALSIVAKMVRIQHG